MANNRSKRAGSIDKRIVRQGPRVLELPAIIFISASINIITSIEDWGSFPDARQNAGCLMLVSGICALLGSWILDRWYQQGRSSFESKLGEGNYENCIPISDEVIEIAEQERRQLVILECLTLAAVVTGLLGIIIHFGARM